MHLLHPLSKKLHVAVVSHLQIEMAMSGYCNIFVMEEWNVSGFICSAKSTSSFQAFFPLDVSNSWWAENICQTFCEEPTSNTI